MKNASIVWILGALVLFSMGKYALGALYLSVGVIFAFKAHKLAN